ncbi:MAG: 23S rRNA (uracil(1939)-C(5))-methyltransferase RlmD [Clostridiales bacterium]|nr:MAG: 23S rRNA (uracil(1939)-C(5))-methyltransferase RlmD [Clostridiales bacterium]
MKKDKKTALEKNTYVDLDVTDMTPDGSGVGRTAEGAVVFVPGALAGDRIRAKIIKTTSGYGVGRLEALLSPSPDRVEADCPQHGRCGGCCFSALRADAETRFKQKLVNDALRRIGGLTLECEGVETGARTHYRNKAVYPVAEDESGALCTGFFARRSHRIVRQESCLLENAAFPAVREAVTALLTARRIRAYDETTGKGLLRHIFLRASRSGELCVVLVVTDGDPKPFDGFADELTARCPTVKSVWLNVNAERTNVILGRACVKLWGEDCLTDTLCGRVFSISPLSFYQVNAEMAERLYAQAAAYAAPAPGDVLLDLYCGAGTIGLCAAGDGVRLFGTEIVPEAVENARENAHRNGRTEADTRFSLGDAAEGVEACRQAFGRVDVALVDPPRKGLTPDVTAALLACGAKRIVYISCNPATLARDLALLEAGPYRADRCRAFDLFPRTGHVETVVLLSKGEVDSKKIRVEFYLEDMDMSEFQDGATYAQIKEYVLEHSGLKVSNLYISQIKRKCGIEVGKNYNLPKSEDSRQPQCPPEKEKAIKAALKHFGII